jgi:hypothetical protein
MNGTDALREATERQGRASNLQGEWSCGNQYLRVHAPPENCMTLSAADWKKYKAAGGGAYGNRAAELVLLARTAPDWGA